MVANIWTVLQERPHEINVYQQLMLLHFRSLLFLPAMLEASDSLPTIIAVREQDCSLPCTSRALPLEHRSAPYAT